MKNSKTMYSSSSPPKRLLWVHILAIQFLIRSVASLNTTNAYLHHKCITSQGKYHLGSAYEKNLNRLVRSFLKENFSRGFEQLARGEGPDSVTFMYQCRGDSYGPKCRSCFETALSALRKRCPRNKGGIIWYDQCLMEITAVGTDGQVDYLNNNCMSNAKQVSGNADEFKQRMKGLVAKLNTKAINENNLDGNQQAVLYAAGEEMVGTKKLYAMVQCTKDLWFKSCDACLEWLVMRESACCDGKQGCRVFSTSCTYRYELYPFVQTTVEQELSHQA